LNSWIFQHLIGKCDEGFMHIILWHSCSDPVDVCLGQKGSDNLRMHEGQHER